MTEKYRRAAVLHHFTKAVNLFLIILQPSWYKGIQKECVFSTANFETTV